MNDTNSNGFVGTPLKMHNNERTHDVQMHWINKLESTNFQQFGAFVIKVLCKGTQILDI